jgi:hypothetical protein
MNSSAGAAGMDARDDTAGEQFGSYQDDFFGEYSLSLRHWPSQESLDLWLAEAKRQG